MRRLLLTGASSTIGQALIREEQVIFDHIIAHCSGSAYRLDSLRDELGDKLTVVQADFSSESETLSMTEELLNRDWIPTDIIHLPFGHMELRHFPKIQWETYQRDIDIALRSVVILSRAFLPKMAKARNGRVILMLSSYTGNIPPKYLSSYVTVKYALLGLMKALSAEYAEKGISVNGISPEMTDTNFLESIPGMVKEINMHESPRKRLLVVEDLLPVFHMLLTECGGAVTGQNIFITDGK